MKRIIEIIDDEPDVVECLETIIGRDILGVDIVGSGKCWDYENAPDILLIDYLLPGTSGVEVCRKCLKRNHKPIVIFFSAFSEYILPEIHKLREEGLVVYYVAKPDYDNVIEVIKKILEGLMKGN